VSASTVHLKQFTKVANAGDAASSYVVSRLLKVDLVTSEDQPLTLPNLLGVGSILHWADRRSIVWGTGFLSREVALRNPPAAIAAVRGHLTAERLRQMGLAAPSVLGDPGVLVADLYRPEARDKHGAGLVPHYVDLDHPYVEEARQAGVTLIDPRWPLERYLDAMACCEVILSSSLHGIVFAHAYGIPAAWVTLSAKVHGAGFKFRDYYSSVGVSEDNVPTVSADQPLAAAIGRAALPRVPIDRDALRSALLAVAPALLGRA